MTQRVSALRKTGIAAGTLAGVGLIGGLGIVSGAGHGDHSKDLRDAIDGGRAKNVILFIGDGMGDSEITIARNYQHGANGRLRLDTLPLTGAEVRIAAQGPQAANVVGVTNQTDLFHTMARALGLE